MLKELTIEARLDVIKIWKLAYYVIKINEYVPTGKIKYLRPIHTGNRSSGDDTPLQLASA
jgi:hypothetical protein